MEISPPFQDAVDRARLAAESWLNTGESHGAGPYAGDVLAALDAVEAAVRFGHRLEPSLLLGLGEEAPERPIAVPPDAALDAALIGVWRWLRRTPLVVQPDPAVPALRRALARTFLGGQGADRDDTDRLVEPLDLERAVEVVELPPQLALIEWHRRSTDGGDLYGLPNATPASLGLPDPGEDWAWTAYRPDVPLLALRATAAQVPNADDPRSTRFLTRTPDLAPYPEAERLRVAEFEAQEVASIGTIESALERARAGIEPLHEAYPEEPLYDSVHNQLAYIEQALEEGRAFTPAEIERFTFGYYAGREFGSSDPLAWVLTALSVHVERRTTPAYPSDP